MNYKVKMAYQFFQQLFWQPCNLITNLIAPQALAPNTNTAYFYLFCIEYRLYLIQLYSVSIILQKFKKEFEFIAV